MSKLCGCRGASRASVSLFFAVPHPEFVYWEPLASPPSFLGESEDSIMRNVNQSRGADNSSNWSLIVGALVIGLLIVAVGYSFSPSYVNTAANTRAAAPASTTPAPAAR